MWRRADRQKDWQTVGWIARGLPCHHHHLTIMRTRASFIRRLRCGVLRCPFKFRYTEICTRMIYVLNKNISRWSIKAIFYRLIALLLIDTHSAYNAYIINLYDYLYCVAETSQPRKKRLSVNNQLRLRSNGQPVLRRLIEYAYRFKWN